MNNRMFPRGPRSLRNLRTNTPGDKPNKLHWWHHRRYCPDYPDYPDSDDWYDYDDWHDYDYSSIGRTPMKSKASVSGSNSSPSNWYEYSSDDMQEAYRQGFKDGWKAAMEASTTTSCVEPTPGEPVIPEPPGPESNPA